MRKQGELSILHGMSDIAGQGSYSARGLREIGADATIAVWTRNPFGYPVDIDLHIDKKKIKRFPWLFIYSVRLLAFAVKASFRYDVFHFHFSHTLLPFGLDLFWLRLMGKRIIMEFHGSDIRFCYNREKPLYYPYDKLIVFSKTAIRANNKVLKYADTVITHDEELRKHIPHDNLYITPLRIDINRFAPEYPQKEKKSIIIVHAPSNFIGKGSKYVIESVEKLKKKYDVEFILVQNKTQEEAFELYRKADIIVDQLCAGTYGVFAVEAMAMGKPVIAYVSEEVHKTFPDSLPIVNATIENLTDKLETLICDGNRRYQLGVAGRKYVEEYHDYRKVARMQMDIYENKIVPMSTRESFKYTKEQPIS